MKDNTARTTRKILLSVAVIAAFAAYTLALRGEKPGPVVMPSSLKGKSSQPNAGAGNSGDSNGSAAVAHYKDGAYTGSVADAFYGNVQVQAVISGGKITDVRFLQYPNDNPNSQSINQQATPDLRQEAIQVQNAHVDAVTGATQTSQAFVQSLGTALAKAQT